MSTDDKRIRALLRDDFIHYANKCLKIRTKSRSIKPFVLNKAQLYIHDCIERQRGQTGKVRALILKGRQQGCSTYVGGRFFHKTSHSFGCQTFILTHALDATANLYKMAQRFYQNTPQLVRPIVSTNNTKELIFGKLDSGYKVGTAENKAVGRSSTIQLFHGSEVAFWNNASDHAKGVLQAIPDEEGTEIILESTANGVGNFFHELWQKAESGLSEYIAIFVPWFWQEEYMRDATDIDLTPEEIDLMEAYDLSKEQIAWRRNKIVELSVSGADGQKSFFQEYPCNSTEAFQLSGEDNYIESDIVLKARKCKDVDPIGHLVIGCDPARFGSDRTAIIRRKGRKAYGLESYIKKDTMEVVGILNEIIKNENPRRVFIDIGGLGCGIFDRLRELGWGDIVVGINAGATPLAAQKYYNKRAEMWGELKEWLKDEPCQIPDIDSLHSDICSLKYKIDSNSRLRIESKEDAKKRSVRSPDEADALCLTFAAPTSSFEIEHKNNMVTKKLANNLKQQLNAISRAAGSSYV